MWHQVPNHMKSLKRWTLRPLSDSKRVMWVSQATVPSKQQDRCPAGRYKNIHHVPRAEVKTIQRLLICWVLRAQERYSTRCSVTRTEAPGIGSGGGPGWGRRQTVSSPYSSHPVLCLALVQGGGCTDSIPALRLLIWGGDDPQVAQQNSGWWGLLWRIKFWNATDSEMSSNYSVMEKIEMLPLVATCMDISSVQCMDIEGYYSW